MQLHIHSINEAATVSLGKLLGEILPSCVLALDGDLGVGKTHFVAGLAFGLGIGDSISSPTFALVSEHIDNEARLPLFHMDAYRLPDAEAFFDAGLDEYFSMDGICIIEWASLVEEALPPDRLSFRFMRLETAVIDGTADTAIAGQVSEQIELPSDQAIRRIDINFPDLPWSRDLCAALSRRIGRGEIDGLSLI